MTTTKKIPAAPRTANAPAQISLEDVKALIALVAKEHIQEFEFESGAIKFRIRKDGVAVAAAPPAPAAAPAPAVTLAVPSQSVVAPVSEAPGLPAEEPGVHYITSPIVGTFYRAPSPNASPYVQVGDFARPGQVLCVVEAMKLMNEIECDTAGEVVRVLVENGQPVEYGERLFAIRLG